MTKQKDEAIQRVFKVRQVPKDIMQYPSENISQGYLANDVTGAEVRLRKIGDRYFETYKGAVLTTPRIGNRIESRPIQ